MAKILVLGASGSGKTTSLGKSEPLAIAGLDPKDSYIISVTNKALPWKNSNQDFKVTTLDNLSKGRRIITNNAKVIADAIRALGDTPIKNIVLDDTNYVMQDYYMKNALKGGWDTPKKIGFDMGLIFDAMEDVSHDKNVIVLAHYEEFKKDNSDQISYRMKTTGNMVNQYLTPEGKFDITLFCDQDFDEKTKKISKFFITNFDGTFPAKSAPGMFDDLRIPNDMGYVVNKVNEFYN